jgi:hypothetical protein
MPLKEQRGDAGYVGSRKARPVEDRERVTRELGKRPGEDL